jgi:hypothetical protein
MNLSSLQIIDNKEDEEEATIEKTSSEDIVNNGEAEEEIPSDESMKITSKSSSSSFHDDDINDVFNHQQKPQNNNGSAAYNNEGHDDDTYNSNNNVMSQPNDENTHTLRKKRKRKSLVDHKKIINDEIDNDDDDDKDKDCEIDGDDENNDDDDDDDDDNNNNKNKKIKITTIQHLTIVKKTESIILDEYMRKKMVSTISKTMTLNINYTIYVYHKIVTALKYSIIDNYCLFRSSQSLWSEIIADVHQNLNDLSTPPLTERASRKSNKTAEEKSNDKKNSKQRKNLLQQIKKINKKAVDLSIKQIIHDYLSCFNEEFILDRERLFKCLFGDSFYFNNYNGGTIWDEIKPLLKIAYELKPAIEENEECNNIIAKQMNFLIESNSEQKRKKTDEHSHLPSQKLVDNNIIISSNNQISSTTTQKQFANIDSVVDNNNITKNELSHNNTQQSTIENSSFTNHQQIIKFGLPNGITPLKGELSKMGDNRNEDPHGLNFISSFLSNTPLSKNNSDDFNAPAINIVTNDKNKSASFMNNITKDDENDFQEMIEVIFGSEPVLIGASKKMKICMNKPTSLNKIIFRRQFEIIFQIFSDHNYLHKQIVNDLLDEVDVEIVDKILKALNPITFHLFIKISNDVCQGENYDPFSLFRELMIATQKKSSTKDASIVQTMQGFLQKFENITVDELLVTNTMKFFKIVNLYFQRQNKKQVQQFPIMFQGNPSCFSILPYLLFQQCNPLMMNMNQNKDDDQSTNNDEYEHKEEDVWGILSMYRTFLKTNYIPGFFSPCFEELKKILSTTKNETEVCDNQFFVFQKNGNFKFYERDRMANSFEKCMNDFVKRLLNSIFVNICGENYKFLGKDYFAQSIRTNSDVVDVTNDKIIDNKKKLQLCPRSISKCVEMSLSNTFKLQNNFFCCLNFIDLEEGLVHRRNNFFFSALFKFVATEDQPQISKNIDFQNLCDINYEPLSIVLYHGTEINRGPLYRLFVQNEWLGMDCVNFLISMNLLDKGTLRFEHFSFLGEGILKHYDNINNAVWFNNHHNTSAVKQKYKKNWVGYFEKQLWIIPMFRNENHFALFLVLNPNLIGENQCKILLLDSLHYNYEHLTTEESKDLLRIKLLITEWYHFVNNDFEQQHVKIFDSITSFKLIQIPQQSDCNSCGWYCILFAKFAVGIT